MDRPNILYILSDDQGAWSMGCAGNPDVRTPALDALAAGGTRFANFFCASPVCSPARASLMTGKMPSQHGVHDWLAKGHLDEAKLSEHMRRMLRDPDAPKEYAWPRDQLLGDRARMYLRGQFCYTDMLASFGYVCALSGKWHLGDAATRQAGFSWWNTIAMGGDNYFTPTVMRPDGTFDMLRGRYVTDYITDNAIEFLRARRGAAEPFYLSVHYTAPHAPFDRDNHPAENFAPFEDCAFSSVPEEPPHPWSDQADMTPEKWRAYRMDCLRGYAAALYGMDKAVGRLLEALDEQGLSENTLVLFTGDNGMNVGQHGLIGKGNATYPMNMFEESVRVPAIMRWPGHTRAGAVEEGMFSHVDVLPTLAEIVGYPLPDDLRAKLPGRSFAPILRGGACPGRDEIVICDEYGPVRMVRTERWKYVHRYPYGPHEMYDLQSDPQEKNNLADRPEYMDTQAALKKRLDEYFLRFSDPAVDGRGEGVCGIGQTDFAGVYAEGRVNYNMKHRAFSGKEMKL